jgi:hypothetical protein
LERIRFQEKIRATYPDAYDYADGAIIINQALAIVFFSDGAAEIFGFDPILSIGSNIHLISCPSLSIEFLRSEYEFFAEQYHCKGVFSYRGRPVRAGAPLSAKDSSDRDLRVRAGVHPLILNKEIHLLIFFQQLNNKSLQQNHAALNDPASPFQVGSNTIGGQFVEVGNWFTRLPVKTQIYLLGIGLIVLAVWVSPNIAPHLLKRQDSPTNKPPNVQQEGGTTRIRVGG